MNRNEKTEFVVELGEKLKTAKVARADALRRLTVAQIEPAPPRAARRGRRVPGRQEHAHAARDRRRRRTRGRGACSTGRRRSCLGYEDPIAVTKVVAKWAETEAEKFIDQGRCLRRRELLEAKGVVALSKTPSKEVLRAQLLGVLQAPAREGRTAARGAGYAARSALECTEGSARPGRGASSNTQTIKRGRQWNGAFSESR